MDNNIGKGTVHPADTDEFIEVTAEFSDGKVIRAEYKAFDDETAIDCAATVCRVIKGHDVPDIMQMTNNAVFYNTENKIPRAKLYIGAMATMAAKKAAYDYAKKNGIDCGKTDCCCME